MQKYRDYINIILVGSALLVIIFAVYGDVFRFLYTSHHLEENDLYQTNASYIYPPFYAFLLTPLAHFPEIYAHMFWLTVNVCLIFFGMAMSQLVTA
jgi:hypothetical protein